MGVDGEGDDVNISGEYQPHRRPRLEGKRQVRRLRRAVAAGEVALAPRPLVHPGRADAAAEVCHRERQGAGERLREPSRVWFGVVAVYGAADAAEFFERSRGGRVGARRGVLPAHRRDVLQHASSAGVPHVRGSGGGCHDRASPRGRGFRVWIIVNCE